MADNRRRIAIWLLVCCALIFAMVVLGGVTRLTGSGLSMVHWKPVTGIVPPLSESAWGQEFSHYQGSPQYQKINRGMSLAQFKRIYWYEFSHRLLGRSIGLVFLLPFLWFWMRGKIEPSLFPQLITMFVLGGLQGLLGWYMVQSGLVDRPHVSQYRLTAHLALAVVIYGYIFWVALGLLRQRVCHSGSCANRAGWGITALVFLTMLSGGFVAGLKAGSAYNTFPLMNGQWLPDGIMMLTPVWRNFFENLITVQFDHRLLATLVFGSVLVFWFTLRGSATTPHTRLGLNVLLAAMLIQVSLGISTLLLHVPVPLAAAHQAGALTLLTASLFVNHIMRVAELRGSDPFMLSPR